MSFDFLANPNADANLAGRETVCRFAHGSGESIQHRSNDHVVQSLTITGQLCASDSPLNHYVEIAEFQAGDFHLPAENEKEPYCYRLGGQLLTRRTLSVLTSDSRISKRAPNDVRWEKVQQIKPNVTGGTYPVPPEQVAAKLIEHMRDRGRAMRRRKRDSSEDPFPHGSTDFQKLSVKENATVEQATLKSLLMVRMAKF